MAQILINDLIRQLKELQDGSRWFDQCFKEKIEKLTDAQSFYKPLPEIHSVAEHISHIIQWRKECLLRFKGERTELMNSPDDWKNNEILKEVGWPHLKNLFYEYTNLLIAAIEDKDDSYLDTKFQNEDYTFHYIIEGIIQHDIYHLGQIGVTIKLLNEK
jgi:uncharacterized damage-inducible protein DinB